MSVTPPPLPLPRSGAAERFERARELFGRAVGLDAAGRAALLERECGGDAELRVRVMALLAADDEESAGPVAPGGGRA